MSPDELRDAERLVDQVRPRLEMRRARRQVLHRHGRLVAARQMFRANLQNGGDLVEWLWRRPAMRPRSITVICDVSGSMERHSRLLMRFAMALHRVSAVRTEAFVFGTHLTRVTHELAGRDPDAGPGARLGGRLRLVGRAPASAHRCASSTGLGPPRAALQRRRHRRLRRLGPR